MNEGSTQSLVDVLVAKSLVLTETCGSALLNRSRCSTFASLVSNSVTALRACDPATLDNVSARRVIATLLEITACAVFYVKTHYHTTRLPGAAMLDEAVSRPGTEYLTKVWQRVTGRLRLAVPVDPVRSAEDKLADLQSIHEAVMREIHTRVSEMGHNKADVAALRRLTKAIAKDIEMCHQTMSGGVEGTEKGDDEEEEYGSYGAAFVLDRSEMVGHGAEAAFAPESSSPAVHRAVYRDMHVGLTRVPTKGRRGHLLLELVQLCPLRHTNLVPLLGYVSSPAAESACVVSEWVHGEPLRNYLRLLTNPLRWHIAQRIVSVMVYLHAASPVPIILHNLHPHNIVLRPSSSSSSDDDYEFDSDNEDAAGQGTYNRLPGTTAQTASTVMDVFLAVNVNRRHIGTTPLYSAPELQSSSDHSGSAALSYVTPAVDVFAFGALLCELYVDPSQADMWEIVQGRNFAIVPVALRDVVKRCLDPDPRQRPTFADLVPFFLFSHDRPLPKSVSYKKVQWRRSTSNTNYDPPLPPDPQYCDVDDERKKDAGGTDEEHEYDTTQHPLPRQSFDSTYSGSGGGGGAASDSGSLFYDRLGNYLEGSRSQALFSSDPDLFISSKDDHHDSSDSVSLPVRTKLKPPMRPDHYKASKSSKKLGRGPGGRHSVIYESISGRALAYASPDGLYYDSPPPRKQVSFGDDVIVSKSETVMNTMLFGYESVDVDEDASLTYDVPQYPGGRKAARRAMRETLQTVADKPVRVYDVGLGVDAPPNAYAYVAPANDQLPPPPLPADFGDDATPPPPAKPALPPPLKPAKPPGSVMERDSIVMALGKEQPAELSALFGGAMLRENDDETEEVLAQQLAAGAGVPGSTKDKAILKMMPELRKGGATSGSGVIRQESLAKYRPVLPYVVRNDDLSGYRWFHGKLSREQSRHLLRFSEPGAFLVRVGRGDEPVLSLMIDESELTHMKIEDGPKGLHVGQSTRVFHSVPAMIDYYSTHSIYSNRTTHVKLETPVARSFGGRFLV